MNGELTPSNKEKLNKQLLGAFLTERRKKLDMTQGDVADKVGCSLSTICLLELGKFKDYKVFFLKEISEVLEVNIILLLFILTDKLELFNAENNYFLNQDKPIENK